METKENKETESVEQPKWTAQDAWKGAGFILLMTMTLALLAFVVASRIQNPIWLNELYVRAAFGLPIVAIYLLPPMYFAKSESLREFACDCGLTTKPTRNAWFGILLAGCAQVAFGFYDLHNAGRSEAIHSPEFASLKLTSFVILIHTGVINPFCEEIAVRGFLFRAFRGGYPFLMSTILIVAFTLLTHYATAFRTLGETFSFVAFGFIQCWLREKSTSLWDCIFGHMVWNSLYVIRTWLV